jgi:hypothetical protein
MGAPAGPTGVIVLKKIADNTYEQYGQITLSDTALSQVTFSSGFLSSIRRASLELKQTWFEDFFSRLSQSQNNPVSKGWPSGSWQSNGTQNEAMVRVATLSGAVALTSDSSAAAGGLWAQLDPNSGGLSAADGRTNTNVDRLGTYYLRWAQTSDTGPATRSLGWQGVTGSRMDTTLHGIFMKHDFNGPILGVCRSNALETTVNSGVSAASGVYHNGRMVVNSAGVGFALIIGEYTGDGASDRAFNVSNYTPACVWIFGRIAATGRNIGAFKIFGMADNVCHPWANNPATGAASRTNRINTLTATGFTVKSDLNVLGDLYMYIVFPPVPGFSEYGNYSGNGWSREGNVTIDTTGGGFHVVLGTQFVAADVGQVMVRVSDGATIGTVSTVTNGTDATGTINISGVFLGGQWRWQPRQIPLSFAPDFGMLCCTTQLGAVSLGTPVQFGPGAGLSDWLNATGVSCGFGSSTNNPLNAVIQTNSASMEVMNDDSTGTGGMNGLGKDYFWYTFKTGSENIKFVKIDYIGDGTVGRTFTAGVDMQPGFFMGFGRFDEPKWMASPSSVTVVPGSDYPFLENNFLAADQVTFSGNATIHMGAGDLNVTNTKYRVYLATGSAQPGGSSVDFYLDNTLFGTITSNVPTVDLKPSMSTATTSGVGMHVDYMGLIQNREAS